MATKVNAGKMNPDKSNPDDLKKDLMLAQEINFAKVLAGNDKRMRDKAVKKLVKWLAVRSKGKAAFTEDNFQRIWSGLFYCMWMSDKFLVQEELAESISKLVHCFHNNKETALLFMKCFYKIMSAEWAGIDQHRIDKFCMLIRRFLRQCLEYCRRTDWDDSLVKGLCDVFEVTTLNHDAPNGFLVHFIDIYPEEIAKVGRGKLRTETSLILFEPIIKLLTAAKDERTISAVNQFSKHLIKQTDVGIEYEMKLNAWKQMGMPSDKPEELELVPVENDEQETDEEDDLNEILAEGPMDPRAGRVDAVLPPIPVDVDGILGLIEKCTKSKTATTTGLCSLKSLKTMFINLQKGEVPEKIVKPAILNEKRKKGQLSKCVADLMEFTNKLYEEEAKELELTCNEVDTDDEESDLVNGKESEDENAIEKTKKTEKKKRKKKRKKKSVKVEIAEKKVEKSAKERKMKEKSTKPKSTKETFIVEDVGTESNKLVTTPSKKRKALTTWQIHDIEADSEEYKKIIVPKIIKLEKKGFGGRSTDEEGDEEIVETPVRKAAAPQLKLTPSFWDKAKEKAAGKKRKSGGTLLPNPFFPGSESKTSRRISFALERNEAQENEEYLKEVRNSPSIPFDASRKPVQSALKSGLSPSPINPFYRFKKFK